MDKYGVLEQIKFVAINSKKKLKGVNRHFF